MVRDFIHGALLEFEPTDFRKVSGKAPTAYIYEQNGNILEEKLKGLNILTFSNVFPS